MSEFNTVNKVFIKSPNQSNKLINRYFYALMAFYPITIIFFYLTNHLDLILPLLISLSISLISTIIFDYIINLIKKNNQFTNIFTNDYIHIIALIIGLFGINIKPLVIIIASFISTIIKHLDKRINLSASLYGILVIIIYKYYLLDLSSPLTNLQLLNYTGTFKEIVSSFGNTKEYLLGVIYLSPILSIIAFIYLFIKKSTKYCIVTSYIISFITIMFIYGIFSNMPWFVYFELITGNILFLTTFIIGDYKATPALAETQIIYGFILGLITAILRFIIPELSVIAALIIGPFILTNILESLSPKLKYQKRLYYITLSLCFLVLIITSVILILVF